MLTQKDSHFRISCVPLTLLPDSSLALGSLPNKEAMPLAKIQAYLLPGPSDIVSIIYKSGRFFLSFTPSVQEG